MKQIGATLIDEPADCTSSGPICYSCPYYDECETRYEEPDHEEPHQ